MLCQEVQDRLVELQEGSLEPSTTTEIQKHLEQCKECQSALRWLQHMAQVYQEPTSIPPVPSLRDRIWDEWQARRNRIVCLWLGTAFQVVVGAALARQQKRARGALDETVWNAVKTVGAHRLELQLIPLAAPPKTCRLVLTLQDGMPSDRADNLRAELHRADRGLVGDRSFRDGQTEFPSLPVGDYRLELFSGNELLGAIELPIGDEAAQTGNIEMSGQ